MDERSPKQAKSGGLHLVEQDIHLWRVTAAGSTRVIAEVECARRGCAMDVEQCARCRHFVRIETHEAGYLLLCRGGDEHESPQGTPERDAGDEA